MKSFLHGYYGTNKTALMIFLVMLFIICGGLKNKTGRSHTAKVNVKSIETAQEYSFIYCHELYGCGLDTLSRTKFWRKLMNTSPDSVLFYINPGKQVLAQLPSDNWKGRNEQGKLCFYDSLREIYGMDNNARIMYMFGRKQFYNIHAVIPQIDRGIEAFEKAGVDPFYAQAILLIESPGRLAKSNVGAYGPFQLMKSVAIRHGLKVNKKIDQRADFDLSAGAAASLIKKVCIPYTNNMLNRYNISVCETDLWYRLLVLHVYHAGAGNVAKALQKMSPETGNMELIKKLWETNAGGFQNASQNYSQVAIASLLELDSIMSAYHETETESN